MPVKGNEKDYIARRKSDCVETLKKWRTLPEGFKNLVCAISEADEECLESIPDAYHTMLFPNSLPVWKKGLDVTKLAKDESTMEGYMNSVGDYRGTFFREMKRIKLKSEGKTIETDGFYERNLNPIAAVTYMTVKQEPRVYVDEVSMELCAELIDALKCALKFEFESDMKKM